MWTRSPGDYFPESFGRPSTCDLGIYEEAMTAMFIDIVGQPGLRRAPGAPGQFKSVAQLDWKGQVGREGAGLGAIGETTFMSRDCSPFWPVPTTMSIVWDCWPE